MRPSTASRLDISGVRPAAKPRQWPHKLRHLASQRESGGAYGVRASELSRGFMCRNSTLWDFRFLQKINRFLRMMFSMRVRFEGWTMETESRYKKKENVKIFY